MSRREREHLLRFASHASLFAYLPCFGARGPGAALPCLPLKNSLLRAYIDALGTAVASLAKPKPADAGQLGNKWERDIFSEHRQGGPGADGGSERPTIQAMCAAVALVSSNFGPDHQDSIVDAFASVLSRLSPHSLSTGEMAGCLYQAYRLLPHHLPPTIALHTVLHLHATPLPRALGPSADAAAFTQACAHKLQALRWLILHQPLNELVAAAHGRYVPADSRYVFESLYHEVVVGPRCTVEWVMSSLHHALALCLLLVRRAIASSGCSADTLVPPQSPTNSLNTLNHHASGVPLYGGQPSISALLPPPGGASHSEVLVSSGTFVLLQQKAEDGLTLMVHTPSADGRVGENVTYAAVALLAGEPAALPVQLPCRVRLTLLAEDDTLNFRIEALARLHNDEASFASARTSADAAQQSVSVVYSQPLPPNLAILKELQDKCLQARLAFANGGAADADAGGADGCGADRAPPALMPPAAEASLGAMQTELRFWFRFLEITQEERGWKAQLAAKPLGPGGAGLAAGGSRLSFGGGGGGEAAAASGTAMLEWRRELDRRAHRLHTKMKELLRVDAGAMGELPTPAEVAGMWGLPDPSTPGAASDGGDATRQLRSAEGLMGLRAAIVPRVLRSLHTALIETGKATGNASWLHESFGVADLLADDRYKLYECLDPPTLKEMLRRFRSSALEMLSASA